MSTLEERLRAAMASGADAVQPVPMLVRLDAARNADRVDRRRRALVMAAAAAAVVLAVLLGLLVVAHPRRPSEIQPIHHPPRVVRLAGVESAKPGRADIAVMVATRTGEGPRAFLWSSGRSGAVALPESRGLGWGAAWTQQLSPDGTHLVRQSWEDSRLELIDLRTGHINHLKGIQGYCPALAPDNRTVAFIRPSSRDAVLLDVFTGAQTRVGHTAHSGITDEPDCTDDAFAWSPDGRLVALLSQPDTTIIDRRGHVQRTIPRAHVANSSMAWSPDSQRLLLYERAPGRYVSLNVVDRTTRSLVAPAGASRPLGWTGDRIVWLVDQSGRQRLETAQPDGSGPRTWTRLDVGSRTIRTVQWSTRLTGATR